jgi:hypothetical protein
MCATVLPSYTYYIFLICIIFNVYVRRQKKGEATTLFAHPVAPPLDVIDTVRKKKYLCSELTAARGKVLKKTVAKSHADNDVII